MNTFEQDAAWADEQLRAEWWGQVYRRAFQDVLAWGVINGKSRAQENGVDHVVTLARDKVLCVEVKCRRPRADGSDWPDVLLETHSCFERLTPGWIEKPLTADFFAYAFVRSQVVILLPLLNLQAAWATHKDDWNARAEKRRDGFALVWGRTRLNGGSYSTRKVAVPTLLLGEAVKNTMRVSFDAPRDEPPPPELSREQQPATPTPARANGTTKQLVLWASAEREGR